MVHKPGALVHPASLRSFTASGAGAGAGAGVGHCASASSGAGSATANDSAIGIGCAYSGNHDNNHYPDKRLTFYISYLLSCVKRLYLFGGHLYAGYNSIFVDAIVDIYMV